MQDAVSMARLELSLMDLTTLNHDDTRDTVRALCAQARSDAGTVAAVCVYPRFVPDARQALVGAGTPQVRVATVANFPHGGDDVASAVAETRAAIASGKLNNPAVSAALAIAGQRGERLTNTGLIAALLAGQQATP